MDWGMLLASLGIGLVITAFGYLFVPTVLALTRKKFDAKKIKRINIINCVVVWLLFRILQISLGDDPSSGAAVFLWGAIGHWILKKHCLKENESPSAVLCDTENHTSPDIEFLPDKNDAYEAYTVSDTGGANVTFETEQVIQKESPVLTLSAPRPKARVVKYCSRCGNHIDPVSKKCKGCGKQYFKGISWKATVAIIVLLLSLAGNVVLCFMNLELNKSLEESLDEAKSDYDTIIHLEKKNNDLSAEILKLRAQVSGLRNQVSEFTSEIEFIDEYVVFIEDDGTDYYHHYDCNRFIGASFWVLNVNAAIVDGYEPCPLCFE